MAFNLKEKREAKGMTQEQLAQKLGITRQAVGMYENGINKPAVDIAKEIGKELDFDWTLMYED